MAEEPLAPTSPQDSSRAPRGPATGRFLPPEGPRASALAGLLADPSPDERRAALATLLDGPPPGLAAWLEAAAPDLLREAPAVLAAAVPFLAARAEEPAAARLLDRLARSVLPEAARLEALRAVRGVAPGGRGSALLGATAATGGASAPAPGDAFAEALLAFLEKLPASPLTERLRAGADAAGPEAAARAFAAAYEAARAAGDPALLVLARERVAPTLAARGLVASFDPSDESAFDARPAAGASGLDPVGRPAVRSRGGAVLVRGVVFVAAPEAATAASPLLVAVAGALDDPRSSDARERALAAVCLALVARGSGRGSEAPEILAALRESLAGADPAALGAGTLEALRAGLAALS